jgi:hypothetical protein
VPADELARLFHQVLRPAWRTKALEHLRSGGGVAAARQAQAPSPAQAQVPSPAQAQAADAGPWEHLFGQASTEVNKLGRVQAALGRTLRERPDPGSAPSTPAPLPFNARVMVLRRTTQPTANMRWCYITAPEHGATGFCEERYLAMDPPDPNAKLHRVEGKEQLGKIARDAYGAHITGGNDERLYVQGLYEANKDRAGVTLTPVQLSMKTTLHRWEAEEETLKVYRGVEVLAGLSLWIPSHEFMQRLKASGAITSGSSGISKVKRAVGELVDDAIEGVTYASGFVVGLLEGAWSAIVDLFKGAAQMIEAIAKTLYHLVTGNPGRIQDMLMGWVDKMKSAWEHRGEIADQFLKKWNAPSGWDRGQFQGEVLGWVMMTVLIILATAGAGAAANAGSLAARFPQVIQLLKTVDAVGDVTTYLGGALHGLKAAGKLPDAAADIVKGKLGQPAATGTGASARANSIEPGGDGRSPSTAGSREASDVGRTVSQRSVQLLGQPHTLRVVDRGNGAVSLVLCSDCAFVLKEIDAVLAQTTAKGPTKSLRVRLERLRTKVVELEKKMSTGDMKQTEGIPQLDQIAAHLADISRKFPSANPLCVFCAFKGQINYDLIAKNLGFERIGSRSHGQPIYRRGSEFISPDVDRHNGVSGRRPPAIPATFATWAAVMAPSTRISPR